MWTVSVYYHVDTDGLVRGRTLTAGTREELRGSGRRARGHLGKNLRPSNEVRDLGRLLYEPKETYT